mgnify:CR=1 FL=1
MAEKQTIDAMWDDSPVDVSTEVNFIWSIANKLRGTYQSDKYKDVIIPMVIIRRFECALAPTKQKVVDQFKANPAYPAKAMYRVSGYQFYNTSEFDLAELVNDADHLAANFKSYIQGFSANIQDIIKSLDFDKQIDKMDKNNRLLSVVKAFSELDLNPVTIDNVKMGYIFEDLIRRFSENAEAGDHYTGRDIIKLMVNILLAEGCDDIFDDGKVITVLDQACGTGGMLSTSYNFIKRYNPSADVRLFGQEINPETYAICKADMLLKGDGEEAEHIAYGSTLSLDGNPSRQFDFMLSNPPYGKSWKTDADKLGGKNEILDTRFNTYLPGGELLKMIPRTSDGQLLFLLNNVSKMKTDTELGSRIIEVHNGSSLFTGDAGSGESNARRYLIESDLVEAIIALPDNMFYNTGIGTYIWVLSNKKEARRKGKIQLIDATQMKSPLRKNMGNKNCEFTPDIRKEIIRIFLDMEESDVSKIFDNSEFGYWNVTVDRPLRLRVFPEREIPEKDEKGKVLFKKHTELLDVRQAVQEAAKTAPFDDWDAFAKATKLKKTQLKKIRPYITETDPEAKEVAGEADPELRDTENIPFQYEGGIHTFIEKEVLPYAPDAYVDEDKTKIGYEISFTKYFYKPVKLRDMKDILASLAELEKESEGVMDDIVRGLE